MVFVRVDWRCGRCWYVQRVRIPYAWCALRAAMPYCSCMLLCMTPARHAAWHGLGHTETGSTDCCKSVQVHSQVQAALQVGCAWHC